jgi:hypothetical protein
MVRETIADVTQLALLDILFNGIEILLFGNLHLRVSPTRNFNNHIEDAVVLISEEGDVMERGDDGAILFDVDPML